MPKPTAAQLAVITYFDGGSVRVDVRTSSATYAVCARNGWIEPIEEFPFHRTTDAGREAAKAARGEALPSGLDALAELRRTHPRLFEHIREYGAAQRDQRPTDAVDAAERIAEYVLALAAGLTPVERAELLAEISREQAKVDSP